MQPPRRVEDHRDRAGGQAGERPRDGVTGELPVVARRRGEHDAPRVGDEVRDHEPEDQAQDEQALGGEREAARPRDDAPERRVGRPRR